MEFDHIIKLIQTVSESKLTSFTIEEGETKITIKADRGPAKVVTNVMNGALSSFQAPIAPVSMASAPMQPTVLPATYPSAAAEPATQVTEESGNVVKSPLVGTFYASSSPDSPAFVSVGDKVKKGQTLGIIEAMKLMNDIECEFDGVVEAILVENEQMVEYGQPLFRIK